MLRDSHLEEVNPVDHHDRKHAQIKKVAEWNHKTREAMGLENENAVGLLLNTQSPFDIQPSEIIFKDVEPGQIYQMTVIVKNLTTSVKRIRVFQPKNSCFRCDYAMLGPIAPGLSIELVVSFESEDVGEFNDNITIISDNHIESDVKISAYSPMAKIIFEPFVNFGFIQAGKTKSETVLFKNEGSREGSVHILADEIKDFSVDPKLGFVLQKGEIRRVTFSYSPKEPGIFRGEVKVETTGKSFTDKIDVNATCVEFLRFIINEEGEDLRDINFGTVLYGQKKKLTGHLVNNSPEGFYYRIIYLPGIHREYKEENNIMTPHEQGIHQTRRLLQVEPSEGYLKSYDQIALTFTCRTWVEEDHQIWARNYALANKELKSGVFNEDTDPNDLTLHIKSTAIFFFKKNATIQEPEENRVLMMQAEAVCPKVDFSQNIAEFGKVSVGKQSEVTFNITNDSRCSEIKVVCPKTSVFHILPSETVLKPGQSHCMKAYFLPKNFGKVVTDLHVTVNKDYMIPFRMIGFGTPHVDEGKQDSKAKINASASQLVLTRSESKLSLPPMKDTIATTQKGPDYLKESRTKRLQDKNDAIIKKQMMTLESKAKEMMPKYLQRNQAGDKDGVEDWIANDVKGLFIDKKGIEPPRLDIPSHVDSLFVLKPLGHYEPLGKDDLSSFNPDPNQELRRLTEKATTHTMTREINMALSNEMLKHIQAGPKTIDFGKVFVYSRTNKFFHIRNELKHAIRARLIKEGEEFAESDEKSQVISTGQEATFPLVFMSKQTVQLNRIMKYIINEKHIFKYIVKAEAIPVDLDISDTKIELSFPDDSLEMSTHKFITLKNNGNDVAKFDWFIPPGAFSVEPKSGDVDPGVLTKVKIIYSPHPNGNRPVEEESLDLRVKYGNNKPLTVVGNAIDTRCEVHPSIVNFHSIAVGEVARLSCSIKNTNNRTSAVYRIDESTLGPNIKFSHQQLLGKIPPESSIKIEFEFSSKVKKESLNHFFNILIRGSKTVTVHYSGNVIIPTVLIHESAFDFKSITYGNSANLPMTIENTSPIVAKLNLDLRPSDEVLGSEQFSCLKVTQEKQSADDSLVIEEMDIDPEEERKKKIKAIEDEKKDILTNKKDLDEMNLSRESEDEDKEASEFSDIPENNDCFVITLKPNKTYKFNLAFTPQITGKYEFNLPLTLSGFNEYTDLQRPVTCRAVHPRIVLDPIDGVRDFKKKTISQMEGTLPDTQALKVTNPDPFQPVRFFIDTKELDDSKEFHLSKTEGVVAPKSSIDIIIEFRPTIPKEYIFKLPLYVDDEKTIPKAIITLKGESAFPRILFDRREVILPMVPLNVESKIQFYIYNDGYQSVNLKGHIIETFQHFPINVVFPDGPSLNSKRHRLKVELSFTAKYPLSFTTQLFIEDDQKNSYWIYISGTADNSIMTNYSYFQRTPPEEYELIEREDRPLTLKLPDKDKSNVGSERNLSITMSKTSANTNNKIGLGYSPIPFDKLERSCKQMAHFLSTLVPGIQLVNFPGDIIHKNGEQLIKTVEYYAQSSLGLKSKFSADMKKADRVKLTVDNYKAVINFLRREGAFLSNIRPEYLLGWNDLITYYKKNPIIQVSSSSSKLGETAHRYLSWDSWLIIMNQILKLYFVNKINLQKLKAIPLFAEPAKKLPTGAEQSTIFSVSEQVLLRWVELCFEKVRDMKLRISPLNQMFQRGLPYASLVHLYTSNSWKPMRKMKDVIVDRNEIFENMIIVKETFADMNLHYVPEFEELVAIEPRESIMLLTYLFNILPNYLPKDTIVFECKVGDTVSKKVTLNNPHLSLLTYTVKLDAGEDFSIKESQIKIEPKGPPQEVVITFTGRISKPLSGKLIFKPKKEGDLLMAPIVYNLQSKITGRYTHSSMTVTGVSLYEVKPQIQLKFTHTFPKDCNFRVELEYLPTVSGDPQGKKRRNLAAPKDTSKIQRPEEKEKDKEKILPSFFIKGETMAPLKKNKQGVIRFTYLPLTFEIHHCYIILIDEEVGEMQFEIIGIPNYPPPLHQLTMSMNLDKITSQELHVSLQNKHKEYAYTQQAWALCNSVKDEKVKANFTRLLKDQREEETFKLECTAPKDLSLPSHFTIHSAKKLEGFGNDSEKPTNIIPLNVGLRYPVKDYVVNLILKNHDLTDVRVYEYNINIAPKTFKAIIEFNTPVRILLEQGIPVSNPLDKEVHFSIKKEDSANGEYFHCPTALKVRPFMTENLPVNFFPLWKGSALSLIKITNPATAEEFHYTLKGTAEEPLSENHFAIKCNVGEEQSLKIIIENHDGYVKDYGVSIDAYGISGPSRIRVEPTSKTIYVATVKPILGGIYAGCITFTDQNKHYIWYTMELEYQGKKNSRTYEVLGTIRRDNQFDIEIENPTNEKVDYKVMIKGEALSGPGTLLVMPQSKATYSLSFFPLRVFSGDGSIIFTNSRVGEILCKLTTFASEPPQSKLKQIHCEIGKSFEKIIPLENPSNKPVKVTVQPFHSDTFTISEKEFEIAPRDTKEIRLIYTPVEIDVQTSLELTFLTESMGSWRFLAFGKGLYPTAYELKEYVLELQKDSSGVIVFRNPFKVQITVSIKIDAPSPADESAFNLINKKTKATLASGANLQIPISFYASEIRDYNCTILLHLNEKINWRFPIKLITESKTKAIELSIDTVCRKKTEKEFEIHLPGLSTINALEPYHMQLNSIVKGDVEIVKKWFSVVNDQAFIDPETQKLKFTVRFHPQKPMKTIGELLITRESGGKWR